MRITFQPPPSIGYQIGFTARVQIQNRLHADHSTVLGGMVVFLWVLVQCWHLPFEHASAVRWAAALAQSVSPPLFITGLYVFVTGRPSWLQMPGGRVGGSVLILLSVVTVFGAAILSRAPAG